VPSGQASPYVLDLLMGFASGFYLPNALQREGAREIIRTKECAPMSLAIDTEKVAEVMLPDGWHTVAKGSFTLDAYEYEEDGKTLFRGGHDGLPLPATGFVFTDDNGQAICGPISSIRAVKLSKAG